MELATVLSKLGCMTSVNIWKEPVVYNELTMNECQKDLEFCSPLDEVCRGSVSKESMATLRIIVVTCPIADKFRVLQCSGQSPICLLPNRSSCEEFNNAALNSLQSGVIVIACTNSVDEAKGTKEQQKSSRN